MSLAAASRRPFFGAVLVEQLEQIGGGVLVKGVGELGDRRGDLQALVKNNLLALKADIRAT